MYAFLIVVHVLVCLVLITVVLLQAGRGGGMSDMVGGGQTSSLFGTQTNEFMTRATEVCAVIFILTSLSLAVLTAHRGKSLVDTHTLPRQTAPAVLPKDMQDAINKEADDTKAATAQAVAEVKEEAKEAKVAEVAAVQADEKRAEEAKNVEAQETKL